MTIQRILRRMRTFYRYPIRTKWMAKLLGLEKITGGKNKPGLVLIQIDGFSHHEFQKALKKGEMPYLKKRLKRESYDVHPMYSGLPSNTPSVQGELFYGVTCAVPAFSFFDHKCGRLCKMVEPESAKALEVELSLQGQPLLQGGSSYSNIYTGGAREPRFCAASMGWGTATKAPGMATLILIAFMNGYSFLRALAFGVLEIFIAIYDGIKGVFSGERPAQELKFIFARIAICIFLREWITGAAKMDLARGMPVVHLNLIGYDEQAHRRGPESLFAHWVLKGIDDSIKRIWKAAEKSDARQYEVWIYSDHGQLRADPYEKKFGITLHDQVMAWNVLTSPAPAKNSSQSPPPKRRREMESDRFQLLGGKGIQKWFSSLHAKNSKTSLENENDSIPTLYTPTISFPIISDLGPVALIYLGEHESEARLELGKRLAMEGGVPIVFDAKSAPMLTGWSSSGSFNWPKDAELLVGQHPFLSDLIPDLERLCRHKNAGDLVLLGWKKGMERTITFCMENGSHGGISPLECTPFIAIPKSREGLAHSPGTLRPNKLRAEALAFLGREATLSNSSIPSELSNLYNPSEQPA